MKKRSGVFFCALALVIGCLAPMTLTGCSVKKPGGDGKVGGDLRIVSFYNIWADDEKTAVGAAVKAYKEEYGANVEYKQYDYSVYNNKLVQMVAGGNAPDLIFAYWGDMPRLAAIELIQPVDSLLDVSKQNLPELMNTYMWKGKHYAGTVQQVQTPLLWFNKSLMEKEGIDKTPYDLYKEGNWNWNTFLELGKKLTRDTDGDGEIDQWGFNSINKSCFRWSNNAPMVRTSDSGAVSIVWKEEPYIRAEKFMQQIRFDDVIMPQDMSISTEQFGSGKLAMAYGTYEFLGSQIQNNKMDAANIGLAPFPTGPDFTGSYYAVSNLATIANGAKNPKGAGRLCEMICEKERELFGDQPNLGNPNYSQYLTDEHMEIISAAISNAKITYDGGWGNWDPTYIYERACVYDKQDVVTTLDSVQPLLQAAINDMLNSTVDINVTFKAPEPQDFENGLGIFSGERATAEKPVVTAEANEVIAGKSSMKLTSTDLMQVLAYTDTAKLSMPTYRVYKVSFDYKILSASGKKADFALTTRTMTNLDNDLNQTGWLSFSGAAGDTGSVSGEIELMLDDVKDYVFAFISGINAGSVAIDNFTVADVTPKE